jgi:hypothetical protein
LRQQLSRRPSKTFIIACFVHIFIRQIDVAYP